MHTEIYSLRSELKEEKMAEAFLAGMIATVCIVAITFCLSLLFPLKKKQALGMHTIVSYFSSVHPLSSVFHLHLHSVFFRLQ